MPGVPHRVRIRARARARTGRLRRHRRLGVALLVLAAVAAGTVPAAAAVRPPAAGGSAPAAPGAGQGAAEPLRGVPLRVIVKVKTGHSAVEVPGLAGRPRQLLPLTGALVVDVPHGYGAAAWADRLARDPAVDYAVPDTHRAPLASDAPDDPLFARQWALDNTGQLIPSGGGADQAGQVGFDVGATGAWRLATGSRSTLVAVLDSGVDITHPDLAGAIWTNRGEVPGNHIDDDHDGYVDDVHGWNFLTGRADVGGPADTIGHGTHVAGVIAAATGNGIGVAGLAGGVTLLPVPFIGADGGYDSDAIRAIGYAAARGAKVINASWGASVADAPAADNPALADAIRSCRCLFVTAAGNEGRDMDRAGNRVFPAAFRLPNELSVAAVDNRGRLASFSDYGTTVDLAAPGVGILSTLPDGYGWADGTSMATPYVTATAALVAAADPSLTPAGIAAVLRGSARPVPALVGRVRSAGMVSAAAAVAVAVAGSPRPVTGQPLVPRLAGADRYTTAAAVADRLPAGGEVAYLATGTDFADALAGAVLAAHDRAPLLLTEPDQLPESTAAALTRARPARLVVLGDETAVAAGVAAAAASYTTTGVVTRLAGTDRYGTAAEVASRFPAGVPEVYLATGSDFPDALAAVPVASAAGVPVLLTPPTTLPGVVARELARLAPQRVVVVGGTSSVSAAVAQAAGAAAGAPVTRVAGVDRYDTAARLARRLPGPVPVAYVATGEAFPDAVAGAALAGAEGGPVLLTPGRRLDPVVAGALAALRPAALTVLGDRSAVADRVAVGLRALTR